MSSSVSGRKRSKEPTDLLRKKSNLDLVSLSIAIPDDRPVAILKYSHNLTVDLAMNRKHKPFIVNGLSPEP